MTITIEVKIKNEYRLYEALQRIECKLEKLMADTSNLTTIVSKLVTDTSTALKDIADKLSQTSTTDPAAQAAIDKAVADLTALDAQIVSADPGPQTPPAA